MDKPYDVLTMNDTDRIGDGATITRYVEVRFRVGKLGPFTIMVEKTPTWQDAMRAQLDDEVRRVQSIAS